MRVFTLPLALLLLAPGLQAQTLQADNDDRSNWTRNDHWESTQLDFKETIYGVFSKASCSYTVKSLLGCIAGLNKMKRLQSPDEMVLVKLAMDGSGSFYEEKIQAGNDEEYFSQYALYLRELKEELERNPEAIALMPLNIENKVEEFEAKYVTATNDSMSAGMIYNEYKKIAEDPHSYLIPLTQIQDMSRSSAPRKGIGITFLQADINGQKRFVISKVVEGSPAQKSGIKVGDVILSANEDTSNDGIYEAIKEHETINFLMERKTDYGLAEIQLKIEKGIYKTTNVNHEVVERDGKKYGYIKLDSFMSATSCEDIHKAASPMTSSVDGFILDLRNNGGGRVDQARCIFRMFLDPGSIDWATRDVDSNTIETEKMKTVEGFQIFKNFHTVTLINGYSASASEATAIYLRDYRKSFIVGERSFGKGSMQGMGYYWPNMAIVNAQTKALYYGPKGISPQVRGVTPDFVVYPKVDQTDATPIKREADRYVFPIEDKEVNPKEYMDKDRLEEIAKINTCLSKESDKMDHYESKDDVGKALFDNQLEEAVEIIECANKYVPYHSGTEIRQVEHYDFNAPSPIHFNFN